LALPIILNNQNPIYMSKIPFLVIAMLVTAFSSCSKNSGDTMGESMEMLPPIDTTKSTVVLSGRFENGPYGTTSGKVSILKTGNSFQLRLDSFRVNSGPDLKVYVSKQRQPLDFFRVGSLKAFSGDQVYDLSFIPDFPEYSYVLIHCEKFNHLFGAAVLMEQ
jgi:Electron transfer DM13